MIEPEPSEDRAPEPFPWWPTALAGFALAACAIPSVPPIPVVAIPAGSLALLGAFWHLFDPQIRKSGWAMANVLATVVFGFLACFLAAKGRHLLDLVPGGY